MAQCTYCKTETDLYDSGVPICFECSDAGETRRKLLEPEQQIRTTLIENLVAATARRSQATREFNAVISQFPSGFKPDSAQRIQNASHVLATARKEMMRAHNRLNDYLSHGIVPDDLKLKRSAGQN